MANIKQPKPNQSENNDEEILKPNVLLETEKEHKDWYDRNAGKMRGKPQMVNKEIKKEKGSGKHSLRKQNG